MLWGTNFCEFINGKTLHAALYMFSIIINIGILSLSLINIRTHTRVLFNQPAHFSRVTLHWACCEK